MTCKISSVKRATSRSPKKTSAIHAGMGLSARRAQKIIDALMKEMQRGLRDPAVLSSPEWELLFGSKQSAVGNIQKLVAALVALPALEAVPLGEGLSVPAFSAQEMELLTAWLTEDQ